MKNKFRLHNWHWLSPHHGSYLYDEIENSSGVYLIYAYLDEHFQSKKVVYIGKAKNLRKRITSHPIESLLHNNNIKTCCKIKYCESYGALEASLIRKLKPIFNLQHNKEFVTNFYTNYMINQLQQQNKENTYNMELA